VTHITRNQYGLPADLAVMSLHNLATDAARSPNAITLGAVISEVRRARAKFPGKRFRLAALVEEVGELAHALVSNDRGAIIREAIQVAGLGIRIAEEGDEAHYRPDGFVEMVYDLGNVARYLMQRRWIDAGSAFRMLRAATDRIMINGDATFNDVTDEEAQP